MSVLDEPQLEESNKASEVAASACAAEAGATEADATVSTTEAGVAFGADVDESVSADFDVTANKDASVTKKHTYVMFSALYAPHMGGVEAYTAGLAQALIAQGHRVIVATSRLSKADPVYELLDGVEVFRLPCLSLLDGRLPIAQRNVACSQQLEIIAAARPDRVVINTRFYGHSLIGAQFARDHNLPAIIIEHGSAHLSLGNATADEVVQRYEHAITNKIKAFGYPFFAVSEQARQWLSHFNIDGHGIVANALDAEAFAQGASARNFRDELGLNDEDILVASVGRLVPEKGISAILEAASWFAQQEAEPTNASAQQEADSAVQPAQQEADSAVQPTQQNAEPVDAPATEPRIVFAIAGDGPLRESVQAAGDNVRALGRLTTADVAALLRDADTYVLPSRSEGFSTTLLEAVAMEAFPLTTHVGGSDELGIGEEGGIILPDESAASVVAALRVFGEHRDALSQQAHTLSVHARQNNTWEASARQLDAAFELAAADAAKTTAPANASASRAAASDAQTPGATASASQTDASAAQTPQANDSEVFEGDERLDQLHRVLLMMLKDFADICAREDIPWLAHYGTAIGALRHGGFIPWDDDLDLIMLRADLDRFIAAVQADPSDKYFIVNSDTHSGYPLATTRFVLANTEFRDSSLATMDFPSGIFLDLFPLDALADNPVAYKLQTRGAWFFNKLAIAKLAPDAHVVAKGLTGKVLKAGATVARGFLNLPGIRALDPNKPADHFMRKLAGVQTRRIGYPCDTYPDECIYDIADMLPARWVPFEDTLIPLPNKVEEQLSELYGDWMTPPPGNERKAHYPDILDFGPYASL